MKVWQRSSLPYSSGSAKMTVKKQFGNGKQLSFSERVVLIALSIPRGQVTTYGRISKAAGGGSMSSQSITSILGKAWKNGEKKIPFHRIVYADGRMWIDEVCREERLALYKKEKIEIEKDRVVDFWNKLYLAEF